MIDLVQKGEMEAQRVWTETVRRMFASARVADRPMAGDVAEGVALFCLQRKGVPACGLSLVAARSFCAAGDPEAAEQILCADRMHRRHAASWLDAISAGEHFASLFPLFAARVLRPQHLASAGAMWVLDFTRVQMTEADANDLALYATVRQLTEWTVPIWERTGGRGTLGLRGLIAMTRGMGATDLPFRLRDHAAAVLARCARKNGWAETPAVLLTATLPAGKKRNRRKQEYGG